MSSDIRLPVLDNMDSDIKLQDLEELHKQKLADFLLLMRRRCFLSR